MVNKHTRTQTLANDGVIPIAEMLSLLMAAETGVAFGVKGLDGRYQLANQAMARLLHPAAACLAGKSESDLLPAALVDQLVRADQSIIEGATAASVEIDFPVNGQSRHHQWVKVPVLGPDHGLQAIASIIYELAPLAAPGTTQETVDRLEQANLELQQTVIDLKQAAGTDKLTGTWNRRRLEECVHYEMDRRNRYGHPLSMLIIDIDFFKVVNDQNGHATGDQVLQTLATLLRGRLRGSDTLARWGGEEFVVLCPNSRRSNAAMLAERLRKDVATAMFPVVGLLTVSIGVAECEPRESWQQWFERADEALYRAKRSGRNQVQLAAKARGPDAAEEYIVANFVQLVWRSAYESGDERIDHGHRQLFADANELLSAILSGETPDSVGKIVDSLMDDVVQHFRDEEAVIGTAGFPAAVEHIVLHRELVDKASRLVDDYRAGKQGIGDVFQFLAYDLVTKHMLGADRQFFAYVRPDVPPADRTGDRPPTENARQRGSHSTLASPADPA
ncbi:MAG: diguanylate cyclase [Candidatus Accumulibacter sp.]|nr:diguanylate cyclase [Accumulibacter sp.]